LIETIAGSTAERGDDVAIAASPGGGSKLAADAEQYRREHGLKQGAPMIADLILKS
jgi:hypothetical protein